MISVIIPSYNRAKTIEGSAKSVLNQTHKDIELIIVDDCSSDNTEEVVAELSKQDSRVRYIRHENNLGACAARNTGIDAAKGEYIAFQDSDDAWKPEKLERQIEVLNKYGADICFCKMRRHNYPASVNPIYPELSEGIVDYEVLISKYHASTQTILSKAEICQKHRFDTEIKKCQDLDWCVRAGRNNLTVFADEVLVDTYLQDDSITKPDEHEKAIAAFQALLNKYTDIIAEYQSFHLRLLNLIVSQRTQMGDRYGNEIKTAFKITKNKKYLIKQLAYKTGALKIYNDVQRCQAARKYAGGGQ